MKRGLDWYKRDPIRFIDGCQGMGPALIGACAILIDLLYARDGEMPRDDRHFAGLLGCSSRQARSLTDQLIELGKVSVKANGHLYNGRVDKVLAEQRRGSETRSASGRAGGRSKGEPGNNAETDANPTRTDHETPLKHQPIDGETRSTVNQINGFAEAEPAHIEKRETREEKEEERGSSTPFLGDGANPAVFEPAGPEPAKPAPPELALPAVVVPAAVEPKLTAERFEEFWEVYPHRDGVRRKRKEAYAKYQGALRKGVPEDLILEGARRASDDPTVHRGYARDPTSWLHQEGWADELDTPPSPNLFNTTRGSTNDPRARCSRADQRLLDNLAAAARERG